MEALGLTASKEGTRPALGGQGHAHSLLGPARSSLDGFPSKGCHDYWGILSFTAAELREAIKSKRRGMLTKGVRLLQDNAPVHNSHVAQMEARCCGFEILPHPPYSPNLAPSDFHLFPTMKSYLKGKHFPDDETLISEVTTWPLEQPVDFYKRCVYSCIKRWEKCVSLGSTYVEKD